MQILHDEHEMISETWLEQMSQCPQIFETFTYLGIHKILSFIIRLGHWHPQNFVISNQNMTLWDKRLSLPRNHLCKNVNCKYLCPIYLNMSITINIDEYFPNLIHYSGTVYFHRFHFPSNSIFKICTNMSCWNCKMKSWAKSYFINRNRL